MNFSEQLKNQLNIVEVVGQYVRLKQQGGGQRWVGLCPFHSEKTPSFGVHSGHQYYKCFGCDAAGDVLKFVQQMESLTFPETLRTLAERYSIPFPERSRTDDPESQRISALYEIHEAAASLFQENLRGPAGADARNYLESRGVSPDAMREFRLGLADGGGQQIAQRLKRFGESLLLDSGLLGKRQEGSGIYDRFRGRLMFPIHDGSGKVIAFGGRALRPDEKVKYLNSPETRLYTKSSVLYNMHRAKVAARKNDRMILVEGYMDAIAVYSAGFQEVVASCGTSLTSDQIQAIRRQLSDQHRTGCQIFINFDPDDAGGDATKRTIARFRQEGFRVNMIELPKGIDADEYLRQNGAHAYLQRLAEAPAHYFWTLQHARKKFDLTSAEGRIDAFRYVQPDLELIRDSVERNAVTRELAEYLKVDRSVLLKQFKERPVEVRRRDPASALPPNEKLLLACMLASPDARAIVRHYLTETDGLERLELRAIFEAILSAETGDSSFSMSEVVSTLDSHFGQILTTVSFSESGMAEEHAAEQALDCLKLLEAKSIRARCDALKKSIRELEQQGNVHEAIRLMNDLDAMKRSSGTI